jgi:hypothetical protein
VIVVDAPEASEIEPLAGLPLVSADREYVPLLTVPETLVITNLAVVFALQ